jgi:hypothetical protein
LKYFSVFINRIYTSKLFGITQLMHMIASLPLFATLMVFLIFCPGVHAAGVESAFPNISFEIFSAFIQSTFGPKISLSTVLMLLFTLNENTDLLNLHARNQNHQFKYEQKRDSKYLDECLISCYSKTHKPEKNEIIIYKSGQTK